MDSLLQDLRIALRRLRRQPAFAAAAVLSLALGIGANTAIFSVLDAVLLRPLPYSQPERLALLWEAFPDSALTRIPSGEINWPVWREEFDSIQSIASFKLVHRSITRPGEPRRVRSWDVSGNLFDTLGVHAQLGRTLQRGDARQGAQRAVVLTHAFWSAHFGGDTRVVDRKIWLDGVAHAVVGVLPEDFFFPPPLRILGGTHDLAGEIFVPALIDPRDPDPRRNLAFVARLAPGSSWRDAQREVERRASRVARAYPRYNPGDLSALLVPLHAQAVSESRPGLILMAAAVGLLLLISCLNVASLLLARGAGLKRETAIRRALGASRRRIFRQQMTESLLLASLGGIVGAVLAAWGTSLLVAVAQGQIPRMGPVDFSFRVLLFAWAVTLLAALLFGWIPAMRASRARPAADLGSSRGGSSPIRPRLRAAIVVSEVALATILLVAAGLLGQSLWKLQQVGLGFKPANVLTFDILPSDNRYPEPSQVQQLMRDLRERVGAASAVSAAGAISGLPLSGDREGVPVEVAGRPTSTLEERLGAMTALRFATPGYFSTLRVPFLAGRDFRESDREGAPPVAIVDRSFVERFLPGGNAIGARIAFEDDQDPNAVWREIVGVVEDVKQESLHADPQFVGTVYTPHAQTPVRAMTLVARSDLPYEAAVREVMSGIREVDPRLAVRSAPLRSLVEEALADHRSPAILLSSLAALAMALAMVGLYGVISFIVARRTREIGVRIALGATAQRIFRLVLGQTARWTAAGILLGTVLAAAASRILSGLLFGVPAIDPLTYLAAAALFSAVALLASWLPARRASRVDPSTALRAE